MKLTGDLKKKVEKAETREAARETIEKAGMLLDDEELDQVAGGTPIYTRGCPYDPHCGRTFNQDSDCKSCSLNLG